MTAKSQTQDRVLFWLYIGLIVWAPLPLGSNRVWSSSFLAGAALVLGSVWAMLLAADRVRITRPLRKAAPLIGLWSLFVLYVFWQSEAGWAAHWAPKASQWYAKVAEAGIAVRPVISTDGHATEQAGFLSLALLVMFCLGLALIRTPDRLRQAAYALIAAGVVQSAYGIIAALAGSQGDAIASGTYMNRNHFAGYLEMTLAIGIGILAGGRRLTTDLTGWREWVRGGIGFLLSEKAPLRIAILIMALGLILSRSRMGNSAFMGSLTGVGLIFLLLSHGTFRVRLTILWVSILILDISFLGSYFGLQQLSERIEATTVTELDNRVDIHDQLQPFVQDFLPFGSGLGTFRKAFSTYYAEKFRFIYMHAEDDYLQFPGELGVGALLLPLIVILSLTQAVLALRRTDHIFIRGMSFAAVMAIVSLLIHSFVDFNLQIPANALMFVLMLAFCWLCRYLPHSEEGRASSGHRRHRSRSSEGMAHEAG